MRYYKWTMCERANQIEKQQTIGVHCWSDGYIYAKYLATMNYDAEEAREKLETVFNNTLLNLYGESPGNDWFVERAQQEFEYITEKVISQYEDLRILPQLPICFYKEELDVIIQLDNFTEQRVLFCLLYMHKYTGYDYFEVKPNDICMLCAKKVNYNSIFRALYYLKENGYIMFWTHNNHQKPSNEVKIIHDKLKVYYQSEPVIKIDNEHNIINYYLQYIGIGTFIKCKNCGKMIERTSNAVKYCPECKRIMELERHKKYNQKRQNQKNDNSNI